MHNIRFEMAHSAWPLEEELDFARRLPLQELHENPQLRGLRCVFDAWMQASLDRAALPHGLSVAAVRAARMLGNMHIFDVTADQPDDYFIIWWGANVTINGRRDGLFDRTGDLDSVTYGRWCGSTLERTKAAGEPHLEFVSSRHMTNTPPRYRLLLPLSTSGTAVDRVISAWSYFSLESVS